ncbi:MAG: prepilin-type N-terminal cleavage/methylation domain-containing protein [Candidatus Omnitrophota bacterium]
MKKSLYTNNRSFTLLELIIAIIIVGVLSSLALPRLTKTIKCAQMAEIFPVISKWRAELERCHLQNGSYADCGGGTMGTTGIDKLMEDAGYCTLAQYEPTDPNYYTIFVFEDDGDVTCDIGDWAKFLGGTSLGIIFRSDNNGIYKYYDPSGDCYITTDEDPDWRGL